jgi:addiction module RelE/StbE family toxin
MIVFDVEFAATAKEDFENILAYIGADNFETAFDFVEKLVDKTNNTLSTAPYAGTSYGHKSGKEIRTFVLHKSYTVFYMVDETKQRVDVIYIFNTHKDNLEFWRDLKTQGIVKFPNK